MADRIVKIPGADHPISIEPSGERIVVTVAGQIVADSRNALVLREADYPPVYYIPRGDAEPGQLTRSAHATYCPYKGEASYFDIPAGGERSRNAVWSYEAPYSAAGAIKDHLAFYPNRVDAIEIG
ncbi:Uncharacterized conserved protein, DUF427 family [Arboricoccus pini]|uniref:Uncharacterized conserved protein, DUF427 family n=1 Tax=Arboricoccus pini TaxID=1963835 RepID=A0A212R8Z1_9PROT|nr:DUF427 domain-containing protein [Arboricoccus pini]SNB68495.1 Uncharacterized conserved protein, DUF427 family [Arboricoccus pini]